MRPEDDFDGGANFHRASHRLTSSRILPICLREYYGVRALATPYGSNKLLALPAGESGRHAEKFTISCRFVLEGALAEV